MARNLIRRFAQRSSNAERTNNPSKALERLELWSLVATLLIFVGIAASFVDVIAIRFPGESWTEVASEEIGNVLEGIGLVIEAIVIPWAIIHTRREKTESDKEVAAANERAAEALKQAEKARERTAALERMTAWRRISPDQQDKLISLLQKRPDIDVLVEFERADPEAYTYAWDIAKIFLKAGTDSKKVRFIGNSWLAIGHFGVFMSFSLNDGQSVSDGFANAGVFHTIIGHDLATHLPRGSPAPNLYIFVAAKPPVKTLGDLDDIE